MKSVLFNFYIRYEKGSFQDEEGTVETLKGYILFDRDVTENTVLLSLATKNVEKLVGPFIGLCYFSELDTTYTKCFYLQVFVKILLYKMIFVKM